MALVPVVLATLALAQLSPSPDPKPVAIVGTVVDGSGRPAANVDIWLADAIRPDEGRQFGKRCGARSFTDPGEGAPPILVHARSDAAGRFGLEIPAEVVARRTPPPMSVWAVTVGEGTRVASHRLPRVVLHDDPPIRLELGSPGQTPIRLFGPDGKPVAGARVIPIRAADELDPRAIGTDSRVPRPMRAVEPPLQGCRLRRSARSGSRRLGLVHKRWRFRIPNSRFRIRDSGFPISANAKTPIKSSTSHWRRSAGSWDDWSPQLMSQSEV